MQNKLRILILEDSEDDAHLIKRTLSKSGLDFISKTVSTKKEYINELKSFLPNVVLSDHSMPHFNSIEALELCKKSGYSIPFILVTGAVSEEFAVECIMKGADDYILKGNLTRLASSISNALKQKNSENEREIAIEMLRRSEEHFRNLIENSSDILAIVNKYNTITYVSPSVEKILGLSPKELKNKNVADYIFKEDYLSAKRQFKQAPCLDACVQEVRIVDKNNSVRHLECMIKPDILDSSVILNIRDITDRKIAEDELKKKNEELKKINQEMDSFVYSTSHDLKAPLKSLLGLIRVAQIEFERNTLDTFNEYAQLMEKSIVKLDGTIQKILVHTANSRSEIELEAVELKQIIEEIFEKLTFLDGYERIQKTIRVEGHSHMVSDQNRLIVIFNNLISNAIKYCDISKSNPFININIQNTAKETTIIFEDNGIGIEDDYIGKVFNMFFRATEKSEGSGLGLYIVKEIIEKLGGSINVRSKIREGTTFTIVLPNKSFEEGKHINN